MRTGQSTSTVSKTCGHHAAAQRVGRSVRHARQAHRGDRNRIQRRADRGRIVGAGRDLEVYQRTPAWVLPKVDFDIPPLMRRASGCLASGRRQRAGPGTHGRRHGRTDRSFSAAPRPAAGPVHVRSTTRIAGRCTGCCCARRSRSGPRGALVPRYGIMAKRPVISSTFLPALNDPNTHLVTSPSRGSPARCANRRRTGTSGRSAGAGHRVRTVDPSGDLSPGTVLGATGSTSPRTPRDGLQSYAGTAHPRLPNRWEIVGPLGFVGFAWPTTSRPSPRTPCGSSPRPARRGTQVAEVSQDAFNRWNDAMRRRGKAALLLRRLQSRPAHVLRQLPRDAVYHRPQTITGSRRFARRGPLSDYEFPRGPRRGPAPYRRSNRHDRHRNRLAGTVAYVTGAARGQGRSHCVRLARAGADVVASDACGPVAETTATRPRRQRISRKR